MSARIEMEFHLKLFVWLCECVSGVYERVCVNVFMCVNVCACVYVCRSVHVVCVCV